MRRETVTGVGGQRGEDHCGQQLDHDDDADLACATLLERVDQHGQPGAVLGEGEGDERQLQPAQVAPADDTHAAPRCRQRGSWWNA